MTSISANPYTDSAALEKLLFKATNPSNKLEDVNTIKQFCDLVNKDETDSSSVLACRLLAHKIQSPQEREALQALAVLEACVKSCGKNFHAEVGKFKFLNEMIKLVSPRYLGPRTPDHVKKKVIELMYLWSTTLKEEGKIEEAYQMLKQQGIVEDDPIHVHEAVFASSLSPRTEIPLSEDQSKELRKLLQSKNPDDLHKANKIIKGMVQEDQNRIDAMAKRTSELTIVNNNIRLLNEMLDHYNKSQVAPEELDLFKELSISCENMQPKLHKLASESEDDALGDILKTSDDLSRVLERYKIIIVKDKEIRDPGEERSLLNVNEPEINLLDSDILSLVEDNNSSSTTVAQSSEILDLLTNGSPIKMSCPPLSTSLLPASIPKQANSIPNEQQASRLKGLEELDNIGEEAIKALLPTVSPQFAKNKEKKLSMNDLLLKQRTKEMQPPSKIQSLPVETPQGHTKREDIKLQDLNVPLNSIRPGSMPPLLLDDIEDISITLHFGKDQPIEGVNAIVVTVTNKLSSQVSAIEFRPVVPKGVKVKLEEPSARNLPAHNPFVPPPAITQVMLISNPSPQKKIVPFKYVLSYKMDDEDLRTEMGSTNDLPI